MANSVIEVEHAVKTYGHRRVVDDISFEVESGEIFGLIGPNGAGKTTTIRMMMDIIRPDSGKVRINGAPMTEETKNQIGYLPEERGLYRKLRIIDTILYLAALKGIDRETALARAQELLSRVDLAAHQNKKIEELSRGMGQMVQFIVTIIHDPSLVILDEPFGGLDPVNTELLKQMVLHLKTEGKAVILSTHRMNEVEELCNRVLMINHGKNVLYGRLGEIKSRFRKNSVYVNYTGDAGELSGVEKTEEHDGSMELTLKNGTEPDSIMEQLLKKRVVVNRFEVAEPSLYDIFIKVAGEKI